MSFIESLSKNARTLIGLSVIYLSFGFLFLVTRREIPNNNRDLVMLAAGIVLGTVTTVVAYYFGSSKDKSDSDKADIQSRIIEAEKKNGSFPVYNSSLAYGIGSTMSKEGISYRCIVPIAAGEEFDISKWEVVK